jgi:transposase
MGEAIVAHGDPYPRGWLKIAAAITAQTRSRPCCLNSYYPRLRKHRGPLRAQVAVQHTILTAIWHMLTHDVAYHDLGPDYFDRTPRSVPTHNTSSRRSI